MKEEPSALNSAHSTESPKKLKLSSRQRRVLEALVKEQSPPDWDDPFHTGWLRREAIDRIAGASNGPQIIMELRRKVTGKTGILMRQHESLDRDGQSCWPGEYRLHPDAVPAAIQVLLVGGRS